MSDINESIPPSPPVGTPSEDERNWAMGAHLSALAGGLLTGAVGGWGWFIGPLVIWLMKKDTMPFVADQAKEALNFTITVTAIFLVLLVLTVVTLGIGALLTVPVMLVVGIGALVLTIIATMKAKEGIAYRYPMILRLVK
jgi:uncharacterized Tic20 family protein